MDTSPGIVDAYLARIPEPARSTLEKTRSAIRAAAPRDAIEGFSYGIPVFYSQGLLVGFGATKKHCAFYVMSTTVMRDFADALGAWETSKGTIRFPLDKPLPATLIRKLVKARVAENATQRPSGRAGSPKPRAIH